MRVRTSGAWATLLVATAACGPEFKVVAGSGSDASAIDDVSSPPDADGTDASARDAGSDAPVPAVANGLLLWLRADIGVTQSAGSVTSWADLSGNHMDARQIDDTKRPNWSSAGLSGRPSVTFGGEDSLTLPNGFTDFSRGLSIFVVASIADTGSVSCVDLVHLSNGPEIDDIALGRHDGHAMYEVLENTLPGADIQLGRAFLLSLIHEPDLTVTIRSGSGGPSMGTFDLPRTTMRQNNAIGRSLYVSCGSVHGNVAEVLVYGRALDDAEQNRVQTELQMRWNCCR